MYARRMDIARIRLAIAVAREGSFVAAAESIPVSPSSLTRAVQSLERTYGIRLFTRGRGAVLTEDGQRFLEVAIPFLNRVDAFDRELRLLSEKRRELVRIGMGAISAAAALPALLEDIASGDLAVRVNVASNSELMAALRAGEIDFFIGGVPRNSDFFAHANRFELLRLDTGGSVRLFTRPEHPLQGVELTPHDLARYPVASGSFLRDTMDPLVIEELGIGPLAVESEDYDLLAAVVRRSDYLLVASSLLATMRPDLGLTPLGAPLPDTTPGWAIVSRRGDLPPESDRIRHRIHSSISEAVAAA